MSKKEKIEELSPEEFNRRMQNDPEFRQEMLRRQEAAITRIEATQRERQNATPYRKKCKSSKCPKDDSDDIVSSVSSCSFAWIQRATIPQLRKAVKDNRLSRTRYRIEVARRRKKDYFSSIPDVVISSMPGI